MTKEEYFNLVRVVESSRYRIRDLKVHTSVTSNGKSILASIDSHLLKIENMMACHMGDYESYENFMNQDGCTEIILNIKFLMNRANKLFRDFKKVENI